VIAAWRKVRALNPDERRILVEAAVLLALIRVGLWILPFSILRRSLERYANRRDTSCHPATPAVHRITRAVMPAAHRLPVPTTCLVRALAADAMLRRRGLVSEVRFGVRRRHGRHSTPPEAHAWVVCDGEIVAGDIADLADYAVLSAPARW
jgi:hypothetical protein